MLDNQELSLTHGPQFSFIHPISMSISYAQVRVLGIWLGKAVRTTETILPGSSTEGYSLEFAYSAPS